MSAATYAFVFSGTSDWKRSTADDWTLDLVEVEGTEKVLGHHQIDGAICKVVVLADGKIVGIAK